MMKYDNVPGIAQPVSRIVQGMMIDTNDQEGAFALLDAVVAMGINAFDSAHIYGGGDPDRLFGKWVAARGNRDKIVLLDKGCHFNGDRQRVTPADLTSDLYDCLARLKFTYIDLWVMHRDDPTQPVGPLVEEMNKHINDGLIRAYGGSNWSTERLAEGLDYAEAHGLAPFAVSSPNFSLADMVKPPWPGCSTISGPSRQAERQWYVDQNMPLFTWSSIAAGFFSGKHAPDAIAAAGPKDAAAYPSYRSPENLRRLERAGELAAEKSVTVAQIATAWVTHYPMNIFALIGSKTPAECQANVEALNLDLTPEEMDWLDRMARR